MDEIKISQAIEAEENKEINSALDSGVQAEVAAEKSEETRDFDGKTIGIAVVALLGLFALAIGGFNAADFVGDAVTGAATTKVIDVKLEDLHSDNRAGKLDSREGYMYNDFSFVNHDELWWTEVVVHYTNPPTLLVVPLHYGPREVEDISISGKLDGEFNDVADVYITINPTVVDKYYSLALSELSFNIVKGIGRKPVGSCSSENEACIDREIISCENNPNNYPVLELVYDESLEKGTVEFDGICMKISGSGEEIVRAADRLLLNWYQIMQ